MPALPTGIPTTGVLPPRAIRAAAEIARGVCDAWRESAACTGSPWPYGFCIDTSLAVVDELRDHIPIVCPTQVWGWFGLPGKPYVEEQVFPSSAARCGHTWVVLGDGTLLDPTAGQFDVFWNATDARLDRELLVLGREALEQGFFEVRTWRDERGEVHRVV